MIPLTFRLEYSVDDATSIITDNLTEAERHVELCNKHLDFVKDQVKLFDFYSID